ncbi:MAG: hypothetical protein NT032_01435 [Actinobacteria bacterium]|nr:hypothetical protein [Actinomycetota bacterium]
MAKRLVIHAGFLKTGTTALQASMNLKQYALLKQGVFYPRVVDPRVAVEADHHFAALALIGKPEGWRAEESENDFEPIETWNDLRNQLNGYKGTSIFSSEMLCELLVPQIQKVKDETKALEKDVIFTIRPLVKILPSAYQQKIKFGQIKVSYETWLEQVFDPKRESSASNQFWLRHDYPAVLQRWIDVFTNEHVGLVVADENNRDFIFETFNQLLKLEKGTLRQFKNVGTNRSLTMDEGALLKEINRLYRRDRDWTDYKIFIREGAAKFLTDSESKNPDAKKLLTPQWAIDAANETTKRHISAIKELKIYVLGNLDSLADASVPAGENEIPEMIPVKTAARMFLSYSREDIVKRLPNDLLFAEVKIRIKEILNPRRFKPRR